MAKEAVAVVFMKISLKEMVDLNNNGGVVRCCRRCQGCNSPDESEKLHDETKKRSFLLKIAGRGFPG
jgi:hypothetical protein